MLRQNVNRIDHVAILVRPENLESAVDHYSKLLGISFEGPFKSDSAGVTYYLDWTSGLEVYAPHDPVLAADRFQYLEEHGEGVFRLIFGVPDIGEAVARARSMGHEVPIEASAFDLNPEWEDRFEKMDEALMSEPIHGIRIAFSQIEPRAHQPE